MGGGKEGRKEGRKKKGRQEINREDGKETDLKFKPNPKHFEGSRDYFPVGIPSDFCLVRPTDSMGEQISLRISERLSVPLVLFFLIGWLSLTKHQ